MTSSWHSVQLVKKIADQMRDPEHVRRIITDPTNRNPDPLEFQGVKRPILSDLSPADYMGILLVFSELDRLFPDEAWDSCSHIYILKIKESLENNGPHALSIFGGLAGLCFAVQKASRGESRYQRLISTLNSYLVKGVEKFHLTSLNSHLNAGEASDNTLYESISGIAGICAYTLNSSSSDLFDLTQKMLRALVNLTQPIKINEKWVPGWYVPNKYLASVDDRKHYPNGYFNLGLSHGMPGILAILAIALLCKVEVEGQEEAVKFLADWLRMRHSIDNKGNLFWERVVSFEEENRGFQKDKKQCLRMDAWCYGTPGVARSLFLAGKSLNDQKLMDFSIGAFRSIFYRNPEDRGLQGPTFCHGISGKLLITHLMVQDTQLPEFQKHANTLKKYLLDSHRPEYPFGFKDLEFCENGGYVVLNRVNLLGGVSGILLTLLSTALSTSSWYAPFLIGVGCTPAPPNP